MDTFERFSHAGIVPVVVIDHAGDAMPTARALLDGGVDVMEITFRTDAARLSGSLKASGSRVCRSTMVSSTGLLPSLPTMRSISQCPRSVRWLIVSGLAAMLGRAGWTTRPSACFPDFFFCPLFHRSLSVRREIPCSVR